MCYCFLRACISIIGAFTQKVRELFCSYVQGLKVHSGCKSWTRRLFVPAVNRCFPLNTYFHIHIHSHIYTNTYFLEVTATEHFDEFAFQSLASIPHFPLFFPTSSFSLSPLGLLSHSKGRNHVTCSCLKPNASVCQRAQLCEDNWTLA